MRCFIFASDFISLLFSWKTIESVRELLHITYFAYKYRGQEISNISSRFHLLKSNRKLKTRNWEL
jgi:hypothetical protein